MYPYNIPLTLHDILLLKLVCIITLLTVIGIYLYKEYMDEKRKL
jgi:hypothetical protein